MKQSNKLTIPKALVIITMSKTIIQNNPYEIIYRESQIPMNKQITKSQAENLVRHLGLIYNTFGIVMKDLIKAVAFKFQSSEQSCHGQATRMNQKDFGERITQQKCNNLANSQAVKQVQTRKTQKQNKIKQKTNSTERLSAQNGKKVDQGIQLQIQIGHSDDKQDKQSVVSLKSQKQLIYKKDATPQSSNYFSQLLKDQLGSKKNLSAAQRPKRIQKMEIQFKSRESRSKDSKSRDSKSKDYKVISPIIIEQDQNFNINVCNPQKEQLLPPKTSQSSRNRGFEERLNQYQYNYENSNSSLRFVPGRTKKEREQFPGIECKDCERYYKSMGFQNPRICQCSSRHRSNLPLRRFQKNNFTQQFDIQ